MDKKLTPKLTPKQKAFCDYYLESGNASEAYSRAYKNTNEVTSRTNAAKNLQKPIIKAYVDLRMKQMDDKRIAKPQEVLEYLSRVMHGEEKDQFGLDATLQDRTRAAELLGKRYRLFTERVEANLNNSVNIIDNVPDEKDTDDDGNE